MIGMECRSVQKLHSSTIAQLQIFEFLLVSRLPPFLRHHIHTVLIENSIIHNSIATLSNNFYFKAVTETSLGKLISMDTMSKWSAVCEIRNKTQVACGGPYSPGLVANENFWSPNLKTLLRWK